MTLGQLTEAGEMATRALRLARDLGERGHEAWALRLLGEVGWRGSPPDPEQAATWYRQAWAQADALGMRPQGAHARLGLASVDGAASPRQRSRKHGEEANALFREMGMEFWLTAYP